MTVKVNYLQVKTKKTVIPQTMECERSRRCI